MFQLDDGYQPAIGDWLTTNDKFPSSLDELAARIAAPGSHAGHLDRAVPRRAGSEVARRAPGLDRPPRAAADRSIGTVNEHWGGAVHVLDTTQPEVLAHLEHVARDLVAAGLSAT